jgi:hypothetical protein
MPVLALGKMLPAGAVLSHTYPMIRDRTAVGMRGKTT